MYSPFYYRISNALKLLEFVLLFYFILFYFIIIIILFLQFDIIYPQPD